MRISLLHQYTTPMLLGITLLAIINSPLDTFSFPEAFPLVEHNNVAIASAISNKPGDIRLGLKIELETLSDLKTPCELMTVAIS